jgi:hypothetical protein
MDLCEQRVVRDIPIYKIRADRVAKIKKMCIHKFSMEI